MPKSHDQPPSDDAGFALLTVIALSGLLALLVMSFSSSARVHVKIAENAIANAKAETLADAGLQIGLMEMLSRSEAGTEVAIAPRTCVAQDGDTIIYSITDEAGRIDLNIADGPLILALFKGIGLDANESQKLTEAILDYRDSDDDRHEFGAEANQYVAAGSGSRPRNAPFESVEEVRGALGMTRQHFAAIRPFVTVRSGQTGIDPRVAPDGLVALLATSTNQIKGPSITGSRQADESSLPVDFRAVSTRQTFLVRATALTKSGAAASREAVVRAVPERPRAATPPQPDPGFGVRARPRTPINAVSRLVLDVSEWRASNASATERQLLTTVTELPKC